MNKNILNEGNVYVKGGNQSFAKPERLERDRQRIPQYYDELMNKGVVYVEWCDDDFYELLQRKGIKFSVRPCADFYERTKFELLKENLNMKKNVVKLNEAQLRNLIAESVRKVMGENTVDEKRFLPILKKTYNNLYSEYEKWQYAKYKPQGMDKAIDAIMDAMFEINEIIERIEPLPENPHLEDY